MLGILSWAAANVRVIALVAAAAAIAWGAATVMKKFDRAAQADAVERQAAADVAAAEGKAASAKRALETVKAQSRKNDEDRAAIDLQVKEREDGYVSIIQTLKQRATAASPRGNCAYGADALRLLDDAWHGRAGPAAPAVPDAAGAADGSAAIPAAPGRP